MPLPERRVELAAATALGLVLAVVFAAAAIRLETGVPGLRIVHRIAASLEVIVVLWLGWINWRARATQPGRCGAALLAIVLTALLSYVTLRLGERLVTYLGQTGIKVMTRIMGLLLAAVATQFILAGVQEAMRR